MKYLWKQIPGGSYSAGAWTGCSGFREGVVVFVRGDKQCAENVSYSDIMSFDELFQF